MPILESGAVLLVSLAALWIGARALVTGAARVAGSAGVSPLVVGLTVVAFGTSAPEIVVSAGASLAGRGDVAVGNVVGSNLFNLGVILGLVAVLSPFRVSETLVRRDAVAMAAATGIAAVVLADGTVSRLEGAVLVAVLVAYLAGLALGARRASGGTDGAASDSMTAGPATGSDPGRNGGSSLPVEAGRAAVGLALVVGGGRTLVDAAVSLALSAGVSEWVIGATVVAAGTSVPELATSVVAARRGDVAIAAGNVVGSNVFNALGVLGVAGVLGPAVVDPAVFVGLAWLGVLTAVTAALLATGRRLTRLEGVGLLALGLGYWVASGVV